MSKNKGICGRPYFWIINDLHGVFARANAYGRIAAGFAVILAITIFSSCGGKGSEAPANVAGNWKGSYTTTGRSGVSISLALSQDAGNISGSFYVKGRKAGNLTGTVSGSSVVIDFASRGCTASLKGEGEMKNGELIMSFTGFDCLHSLSLQNAPGNLKKVEIYKVDGYWSGTAASGQKYEFEIALSGGKYMVQTIKFWPIGCGGIVSIEIPDFSLEININEASEVYWADIGGKENRLEWEFTSDTTAKGVIVDEVFFECPVDATWEARKI